MKKTTYSEELLSSRDDMSNYDCSSERVDDVFVIWMKDEAALHFA